MAEPLKPRWTWTAIALALALGVAAGRSAFGGTRDEPSPVADTVPAKPADAAPEAPPSAETGITRYQVPVTVSQPAQGPSDALVTIVEWCDFQSAACREAEPIVAQVRDAYAGKLRLVFRHMPPQSLEGQLAHEFAQSAHERADKFWQVKDALMHAQGPITLPTAERIAKQVDLDWPSTLSALEGHAYAQHVGSDAMFAKFFEVVEVPAFFVNGRRLAGKPSVAGFRTLIDDELQRAQALVNSGVPRDAVYANLIRGGKWTRPTELDAPPN